MPIDWSNPQQANDFRQRVLSKGYKPDDVEKFIAGKTKTSALGTYGYTPEGKVNAPKIEDTTASGTDAKTIASTQSGLRSIQRAKESIKNPTEALGALTPLTPWGRGLESDLYNAVDVILRARTGAQANPDEIKKYMTKIGPRVSDPQNVKMQKLQNIEDELSGILKAMGIKSDLPESPQKVQFNEQPGLDMSLMSKKKELPQDEINTKGQPVQAGDLVFRDGRVAIAGQPNEFVKKVKDGGGADSGLIKFLANSEFLPIAGSLAGAFAGSGVASIAGMAAGGATGKALQEALKELENPEDADLSDHAKAVLVEGITNAVIGGVFLGLGKGAKLILSKTVSEPAKAYIPKLIRKGLPVNPTDLQSFEKSFGTDWATKVAEGTIPKSGVEAASLGKAGKKFANEKLSSLFTGKTAQVDNVVKILEDMKPINVKPSQKAAISQIDEWINYVKSFGKEIPASEVNQIKSELQGAFGSSTEIAKGSKKLIQKTSTEVRKFTETFHPEVAGTQQEVRFNKLMMDAGKKVMTTEKAKAMWKLQDLLFLATGNFPLFAAAKTLDIVSGSNPLMTAKVIKSALDIAQAVGNKQAVKNIVNLAIKSGVVFTAEGVNQLVNQSTQQLPPTPSEVDFSQLGAFSPEGIPLYR